MRHRKLPQREDGGASFFRPQLLLAERQGGSYSTQQMFEVTGPGRKRSGRGCRYGRMSAIAT